MPNTPARHRLGAKTAASPRASSPPPPAATPPVEKSAPAQVPAQSARPYSLFFRMHVFVLLLLLLTAKFDSQLQELLLVQIPAARLIFLINTYIFIYIHIYRASSPPPPEAAPPVEISAPAQVPAQASVPSSLFFNVPNVVVFAMLLVLLQEVLRSAAHTHLFQPTNSVSSHVRSDWPLFFSYRIVPKHGAVRV
jgi:hypothetical protein